MKFNPIILFGTIFLLSPLMTSAQKEAAVDSSRIVRVLTFNIYHGEAYYRDKSLPYQHNLDAVAGVINALDPDLVALQEVDFKTNRAKDLDLVTELGLRTGMAPLFGRAMEYDGGEYGEGVLSRHSFLNTQNYSLKASPGKEPRAALSVTVLLPCGEKIRFVGTHLDHTSDEERLDQVKQLEQLLAGEDIPTVLAGDLNALPESEPMQILFKTWKPSAADFAPTIPSTAPTHKIDYILYRPATRWRVLETRVIEEKYASDHNPVLTVFELLPE